MELSNIFFIPVRNIFTSSYLIVPETKVNKGMEKAEQKEYITIQIALPTPIHRCSIYHLLKCVFRILHLSTPCQENLI